MSNCSRSKSDSLLIPTSLLHRQLLNVSCLGDSITAGSFNVPHASSIWYPTRANQLIADDPVCTSVKPPELIDPHQGRLMPGCSYDNHTFILKSGPEQTKTGFDFFNSLDHSSKNSLYLLKGEINTSASTGASLALIVFGCNDKHEVLEETIQHIGGYDNDSEGYVSVSFVFSPRYILSLHPDAVEVGIGARLNADRSLQTALVTGLSLKEAERGIAFHNQGVSYTTIAEGLASLEKVLKWDPDICIIAYGTNDIRNGITLSTYLSDLKKVVDILESCSIFPIIATLPPLGEDQINFDQVTAWNQAITESAVAWRIGLWDRWKAFDNGDIAFIEDGRHPTRAGYLRLGDDAAAMFSLGK